MNHENNGRDGSATSQKQQATAQVPHIRTGNSGVGASSKNILNEDLKLLNLQYLLLARNCAIHSPAEALWKYGMNEAMIQSLSEMTINQLHELAGCGRAVITILPPKTTDNNVPLNLYAALLAN